MKIRDKWIYSLGGYNTEYKHLAMCERYNISMDKWTPIPSLKVARRGISACVVDEIFIYAIGGFNHFSLSTIERLDTEDEGGEWENMNLLMEIEISPRYVAGSIHIGGDNILICGGYQTKSLSDTYIFNFRTGVVFRKGDLILPAGKGENFYQRIPLLYEGQVYAIGYESPHLHVYNIHNQEWAIIDQRSWKNTS